MPPDERERLEVAVAHYKAEAEKWCANANRYRAAAEKYRGILRKLKHRLNNLLPYG